jgi:hypothetical protein
LPSIPTFRRTRSTTLVSLPKSRIIPCKTSWKVSNSHNHHEVKKKEEVDTIIIERTRTRKPSSSCKEQERRVDTIMMQKNKKEEVQVIQVRRAQIGKTGVISRGIN